MVNVPPNRWPLQIFQAFDVFWTFDDFLTDLSPSPPSASTPSYSTTIWAALVDESIDEQEGSYVSFPGNKFFMSSQCQSGLLTDNRGAW